MAEIRLDAPIEFKVIRTDDGRLHCQGSFCRDGILEYRQPDGSIIRELRRPETNANPKTVDSFKLLPLVVEHPPVGLLNSKTYKNFTVGFTDSSAKYDSEKGIIEGLVSFFDADAIAKIESKEKEQLSAGYICDVIEGKGEWNGQEYDREQINVRANHLALTSKGRAGDDIKLRLDSEAGIGKAMSVIQDSIDRKRMATIHLDNVTYSDIPEAFASVAGSRLKELEDFKKKFDSIQEQINTVSTELKKIEEEKKASETKADSLQSLINKADELLKSLGFERTDSNQYVRTDKKKTPPLEIPKGEDEHPTDVLEDELDVPKMSKKKKKAEKQDSDESESAVEETEPDKPEVKTDSLQDLLTVWKEADEIIPDFYKNRFDSAFSVADVKRTVLSEVEPELDLTAKSDAFVDGVFSRIKTEKTEEAKRTDSTVDYNQRLDSILRSKKTVGGSDDDGLPDWQKQRGDAYKQPLNMSKSQLGAR